MTATNFTNDPALSMALAGAAAVTLVLLPRYRTASALRDISYAIGLGAILLLAVWHIAEANTWLNLLSTEREPLLGGGPQFLMAVLMTVYALDMHFNFQSYAHMPDLQGRQRWISAIMTPIALVIAFYVCVQVYAQFDGDILTTRGNFYYLVGPDNVSRDTYLMLFCLDQTLKALLFDISEVYGFGLVAATNNPSNHAFATLCLIFRLLISVIALSVAWKIIVNRRTPARKQEGPP